MESEQALERLRSARVGRLSTVTPEGRPHVVPFVFALVRDAGSTRAYWAVDDKPKRSTLIQRLRNLEANPRVSFHLPDNGNGQDIVTIEGTARVDPDLPPPGENADYMAKYGEWIGSPEHSSQMIAAAFAPNGEFDET